MPSQFRNAIETSFVRRSGRLKRLCRLAFGAIALGFAGCAEAGLSEHHEFVQDAIEGAAVVRAQGLITRKKILFSPTSGHFPMSGGQRNMAFLNLAAHYSGFQTACSASRGLGLELLEQHGVLAVDDDSLCLRDLPRQIPEALLKDFDTKLRRWGADPTCVDCRQEVWSSFDAIEHHCSKTSIHAQLMSKSVSEVEKILLRALRLRRTIQTHEIEVIVSDGADEAMSGLLARGESARRVIYYAQSEIPESYDNLFAHELEILAVSDAAAERFERSSSLTVLKNGINLRRFAPATKPLTSLRESLHLSKSAFVIGHTGYIHPIKNQMTLLLAAIDMAKSHTDVHVVFVGEVTLAEYGQQLQAVARSHNFENNVHFLGYRWDVDDILKQLDLYVFPSVAEGFGLGLAEAMASEVPAIASDLVAFHEFVGGSVRLINPEQLQAELVDAMLDVARHPAEAKAKARDSRREVIARDLHTDRMVLQLVQLLGGVAVSTHVGLSSQSIESEYDASSITYSGSL